MFLYSPSVNNSVNASSVSYKKSNPTHAEYSLLKQIKTGLAEKFITKIYLRKAKKTIPGIADEQTEKLSTLSMFLGIFSLAILFVPVPAAGLLCIPAAILAIIFGLKVKKTDRKNKKATAGVILGIVTLSLLIIAVLALFSLLAIGLYNI